MKKFILLFILSAFFGKTYSQENIVSLITTGTDRNNDKAVNKALRNAVEQAFGSFLVSKSTLVNDQLASDEILTVSSGNIASYEVVSTITNPENKEVTATVSSKVSLVKLKSFIESKGIEVDFKGKLFAQNIMMQEFYEQNEIKALKELNNLIRQFNDKTFDFKIEVKEPSKINLSNSDLPKRDLTIQEIMAKKKEEPTISNADLFRFSSSKYGKNNSDLWRIDLIVTASLNPNFFTLRDNFINTLQKISLSKEQAQEYYKLDKDVFPVIVTTDGSVQGKRSKPETFPIFSRKEESLLLVIDILYNFNNQILSFEIDNAFNKVTPINSKWIVLEDNFRPVLNNKSNDGGYEYTTQQGSSLEKENRGLFILPKKDGTGYINHTVSNAIYSREQYLSTINENRRKFNAYTTTDLKGAFIINLASDNLQKANTATKFLIVDLKSLDEIQKVDRYKIYPHAIDLKVQTDN